MFPEAEILALKTRTVYSELEMYYRGVKIIRIILNVVLGCTASSHKWTSHVIWVKFVIISRCASLKNDLELNL